MADEDPTGRRLDRRSLLRYAGVGSAGILAGCTGGGDGGDSDGGSDGGDGSDGGGAGATPSPTQAESGETETGSPKSGGELVVGFESELTGLDPHKTSSVVSWVVVYNLAETLITFEDGKPAGRLAKSWEISDDGLQYTFTLKEGVMFHPPTDREMVADDVVYSFERMNQKEAMGGDLAAMESVEADGDYTVTFTLSEPFAPFFNFLGRVPWVVVPEEAVEAQGGELGDFQEPVGTGPFQFDEHQPGNFMRMTAFDGYREDGVPHLDAVRIRPVPDADSRVAALRAGDVDLARAVPGKDAESVRGDANTSLIRQKATGWGQIHINCSVEPWNDPAVRRAVAHVVDRSAIVEAGVFGFGTAAWQPYPEESVWNFDLGDSKRTRDVEKAKQILADAGNPLEGKTLTFKTNTRYAIMESTANLVIAQLREAGIDAETEVLEWGTQLSDFIKGNFGAMAFSVPFKIDPDRHYYGFVHPDSNQWNKYGEEQPDAQRMYDLVAQGRTETDQDERVEIYTEFQKLVNRNVPWISIARTDDLVGMRNTVQGHESWLLPYTRYWTMWKEE